MNRLARTMATILVLLVLAVPAWASDPELTAVDEAVADALVTGEVPGAVILVGRRDEILYHRAFGWRAVVPEPEAMTTDTIFDIASLTKPVGTAIAVLTLVERGKLALDAPLGRYLREFNSAKFAGVSIRRLLTHSAGFPGYPPNQVMKRRFPRAIRGLAAMKLDYPPGTGFQYSDTGFVLLGEVVRRVSGEPLDRYLNRVLVRPLGLRDTTFRPDARQRERTAPTEWHNGHMLRGVVHDPRARLLGGVAGHAGIFSTAGDLARIIQMLLRNGVANGRRVVSADSVKLMWGPAPDGNGKRTLGWDRSSRYSLIMSPFFPSGSVGHTGFTGTSIWVDPPSGTYLIILTNRVHPSGGSAARIRELRVRTAAAVGTALFAPRSLPPQASATASDTPPAGNDPAAPASGERVHSGLDVLAAQDFALLRGHAIALVTNQTGVDAQGRRGIDLLAAAPGVRLRALFSPEHGITGTSDTEVPHGKDPATGVPIWSLYGRARRPDGSMLDGVSAFVFDIQDVGARYYTYLTTLVYVMEEAAKRGLPVFVLDRPNPITGRYVEGPLMDPDLESFTAPHPIPVRTGMTIGEFARMAADERKIPVKLTVVPLAGWSRSRWFDQTALPWVNPSPNIRSVTQALLYSGIGLLEATNLSVGRGTDMPFEVIGAPWIDAQGLADALTKRAVRGVRVEPVWFTPASDAYARLACAGVRFVVTDREALRAVDLAFAVALALRERHRAQWRPESVQNLLVNRTMMWAFLRGDPLERLLAWGESERASFLNRRASYLIYR